MIVMYFFCPFFDGFIRPFVFPSFCAFFAASRSSRTDASRILSYFSGFEDMIHGMFLTCPHLASCPNDSPTCI